MNLSYFEQRAANNQWDNYNETEYNIDKVIKAYERTSKQISDELIKIDKEIEENGLSRSVVYRVKYLKQLENYYFDEMSKLGKNIEKIYTENLNKAAEKSYSDTSEELKVPIVYNKNNTKRLMQKPWYGATFSNRVWKNQAKLIKELSDVIETGINTGKTPIQMTLDLQNRMNSDLSKTMRLIRTETMHHLNQIKLQSYKDSKVVKQLKDVVTLDDRTSQKCAVCAGRIYDIDKAPSLPRHVNCRCVLVPYIDINKNSKVFDNEELEISKERLEISNLDLMAKSKEFKTKNAVGDSIRFSAKKVAGLDYDIWIQDNTKKIRDTLSMLTSHLINFDNLPTVAIVKEQKLKGLAGYNYKDDILYISDSLNSKERVFDLLSDGYFAAKDFNDILVHELAHKQHWDSAKRLYKHNKKRYNSVEEAKRDLDVELISYVKKQEGIDFFYTRKVSKNANESWRKKNINELVAEVSVLREKIEDKELLNKVKGVLRWK